MTGREFAKLARRHLMPDLPDFVLKDGHIYALPVDRLAGGFHLYASAFGRERFTISCSVYPLYVADSIGAVLPGLGDRLPILAGRGDQWWQWNPDDEEADAATLSDIRTLVLDVGVPFLNQLKTVQAVIERLRQTGQIETDPHVAEALAYSLLIADQNEAAMEMLKVLRRITLEDTEEAEWWDEIAEPGEEDPIVEVGNRGARVEDALNRSPAEALRLLDKWNDEQRKALRLPRQASEAKAE
jgi:hypothetical protein